MRRDFWIISVLCLGVIGGLGFLISEIWWAYVAVIPIFLMGTYDYFQHTHTVRRNFPILGRFRYWLELIRPEINQYFIESNSDGVPFSREKRSVVYQRAKRVNDTLPYGTQMDVYQRGYEWVNHSIITTHVDSKSLRVVIGGPDCKQPYSCSLLNISAMSFGALSSAAIEALNCGACQGNFAHNTGEGGISEFHLKRGGDLIWQIGTGYFGCRDEDGNFDGNQFRKKSRQPSVKMIEIKLSQGAKPGHGGILPGGKVTKEISEIRGVPQGVDVISPPSHGTFSSPMELMDFIAELRELSEGKPIGIKLCIGRRREFIAICKAMVKSGITPDFVAVDGGEGGTGAAPLEFSNHVGSPGVESIAFVHNCLVGFGIRDKIRVFGSGKVTTAFDMIKRFCIGADVIYGARSFMMAVGCIQALRCNANVCPTGVATQDPQLVAGLVVNQKNRRVKAYHEETMDSLAHILGAMGMNSPSELKPWHLMRRVGHVEVRHYGELLHFLEPGDLLDSEDLPRTFARACKGASEQTFGHVDT